MRILLSLIVAVAALSCRTAAPAQLSSSTPSTSQAVAAASVPTRLTLVATNDVHGWVQPRHHPLPDGTQVVEGGASTFAGYLSILRSENPGGVLVLDGGDLFQGTLPANLSEGSMVIRAYNKLGYTAAAIGNHEFDYGPIGPLSVATTIDLDPFGALKERLREATFPLLAVNVYDAQTGERPQWLGNDGTLLLEVKGVKVGILGLITPTTPQTTNPVNVATLRFGSLVPEAASEARKLRERGAELVIAVAHAGGKCSQQADPHDISNCDSGGEIFELLQALPPKTLDAVVAGHTHQSLGHFVNGTPVIESAGLGRTFGILELFIDAQGTVLQERTKLEPSIPICHLADPTSQKCDDRSLKVATAAELVPVSFRGKPVQPDPSLDAIIEPSLERARAEQQRDLGLLVPERLWRNYEAESALGRFLTDSLRTLEQADVALMNSGGLRADLPAGPLSYGDVYEVLPFDNTIATLTLTGEELDRLLHAAYGARKGVFQVSGLKVSLTRCPSKDRLRSFALADGRPVKPDRRYKVVLPDFLARGGDGLGAALSSIPASRIDLGTSRALNFRDALVKYWQKVGKPLVASPTERIAFVDDAEACATAAVQRPID